VGDFPEVAVGVGEVAAVAAPEGVVGGLFDFAAGGLGEVEDLIDFFFLADVVGEGDAVEFGAGDVLKGFADVFGEVVVGVEGEGGAAVFEEDYAFAAVPGGGAAEAVAVEAEGALVVGDAVGVEAVWGFNFYPPSRTKAALRARR
jgi:hypothetical protein